MECWELDTADSRQNPLAGCGEYGNEFLFPLKFRDFTGQFYVH
jgi:hypothetical protein